MLIFIVHLENQPECQLLNSSITITRILRHYNMVKHALVTIVNMWFLSGTVLFSVLIYLLGIRYCAGQDSENSWSGI